MKKRGQFYRQMSGASTEMSDDHSKLMHTWLMVGLENREKHFLTYCKYKEDVTYFVFLFGLHSQVE